MEHECKMYECLKSRYKMPAAVMHYFIFNPDEASASGTQIWDRINFYSAFSRMSRDGFHSQKSLDAFIKQRFEAEHDGKRIEALIDLTKWLEWMLQFSVDPYLITQIPEISPKLPEREPVFSMMEEKKKTNPFVNAKPSIPKPNALFIEGERKMEKLSDFINSAKR